MASPPQPAGTASQVRKDLLGKHLSGWRHLYVGIAQIAIIPPPALKRALWGTFFQARFSHFKGLYASGVPVLLAVSSSLVCE